MKLRIVILAIGVAAPAAAQAQDVVRPVARADAWAAVGWHHARLAEAGEYDDWYHSSVAGTLGASWYWTDHLRTEIDAGATSRGRIYVFEPAFTDNQITGRYGWIRHRTRAVGVTHHYQFFRNAWFHPYLGVGVDVIHQTEDEHVEPVLAFDRVGRSTVLEPARDESTTRTLARPAASLGFKAYLTPRAYFRTDARIGVRRQIEDVIVRFGFGVDF
jgi:opacity protein-like surface antigen